jgi:hypothetical protein
MTGWMTPRAAPSFSCDDVAVTMVLGEGEPAAGPWRVERLTQFARFVVSAVGASLGRPAIVALDGRSSSGKTTLAHRLEQSIAGAVTVHTDDIAWWDSFFGWADLLAGGVLGPIRRGQAVAFRPPAWDERGRPGAIELPGDASVVIVEGVGASRREIAHLLDAAVWVQSDLNAIERRNAARVAAGETNPSVVARWMQEEFPFVADQRPWERALVVVAGTPELPHDPSTEVVLAPSPSRRWTARLRTGWWPWSPRPSIKRRSPGLRLVAPSDYCFSDAEQQRRQKTQPPHRVRACVAPALRSGEDGDRMTTARWREVEYELVDFTRGPPPQWVLRDKTGDVLVMDIDDVEVRCERCGRWSAHAAPLPASDRWVCHDGGCYDIEVASG